MNVRINPRNGSGQSERSSAARRNAVTAEVSSLHGGAALLRLHPDFPIDAAQVPFAIAQRRFQPAARSIGQDGQGERLTRLPPLTLEDGSARGAIPLEDPLGERVGLTRERAPERRRAEVQAR